MSDLQAALGLQQLRKLSTFQERRRAIVQCYHQALSQFEECQVPVERPGVTSAWQLYPLRLNLESLSIDRARFIEELRARNIGSSVHFIPIHIQPYYRDRYGYSAGDYPVAYGNYLRLVTLPLNLRMTDSDVNEVVEAVADVIAHYRR
jgi:dTDP-4-amino-4,6-dideoxygalactose transaminase